MQTWSVRKNNRDRRSGECDDKILGPAAPNPGTWFGSFHLRGLCDCSATTLVEVHVLVGRTSCGWNDFRRPLDGGFQRGTPAIGENIELTGVSIRPAPGSSMAKSAVYRPSIDHIQMPEEGAVLRYQDHVP